MFQSEWREFQRIELQFNWIILDASDEEIIYKIKALPLIVAFQGDKELTARKLFPCPEIIE